MSPGASFTVRASSGLTRYWSALLHRKPSAGETFAALDGLRGLAVLIVIASHTDALWMRGFCIAFLLEVPGLRTALVSARLRPVLDLATPALLFMILFTAPAHRELYSRYVEGWPDLAWAQTTLAGILCGALLVITVTPGTWASRLFAWPGLRVVGVLSFGLYLVHWFVIGELRRRLGIPPGLELMLWTMVGSLVLAGLLERSVERPCMSLGRRINAQLR